MTLRMGAIGSSVLRAQHAFMRSASESFEATMRLSTGKRINRGADDPAGLIAASNLSSHAKSLSAEIKSLERDRFRLRAEEGFLSEIANLAIDFESLVVQAANDGGISAAERESIVLQAEEIVKAIGFIEDNATFNGERLLGDSGLAQSLRDLLDGENGALRTGDFETAQSIARQTVQDISRQRAQVGARERFAVDPIVRAKSVELESTLAAASTIEDTDFAKAVSELIRAETLKKTSLEAIRIATSAYDLLLELVDQATGESGKASGASNSGAN